MLFNRSASKEGFTLVELIVVLVILAILAAILIPALLGYIDKSKEKQDMLNARNCLTAAQAEFTLNYANREDTDVMAVKAEKSKIKATGKQSRDVYMQGSEVSKRILNTADDNPYVFIVGCGSYNKYAKTGTDIKKAYTAIFAIYQRDKDSKPIFYDGTKWDVEYPWDAKGDSGGNDNIFDINGEKVELSMYIIKDGYNSENKMWNTLQSKARE